MPEVSVPWGRDKLSIALPEHWQLLQVASPSLRAAPADWADRLAVALTQPAAGLPLEKLLSARRGGRIVLVVEDSSRHSPLPEILAVVLREIRHAGVADEQMELFFATGMHPPMTGEEAAAKLGPGGAGIAWRSNPWHRPRAHVSVGRVGNIDIRIDRGVAEADLRIIISAVAPHLQAGFGGGYKMLVPGCAALETIRRLHRLGMRRDGAPLVGTDASANPMRSVIDAAGSLVDARRGKTFAVQYLLDEAALPAFVATGEPLPAQQMLAKQCSVGCGVVTPVQADLLIVNAHPLDLDLWQSFKCIANTRWAVRPHGVILCLTRCPSGLHGMKPPPWPFSPAWTRRLISLLGPEGLSALVTRLVPRLAGDAAFFIRLATQTARRNPILFASPSMHALGIRFPGVELFPDADRAIAAAGRLLGGGPQRVIVFPSGGTSFPVLTSAAPPAP